MNSIIVNAIDLRAVSFVAAKSDIRYYLNGVMVEVTAQQVRCVATNGHAMAVAYQERTEDTTAPDGTQIILPAATVAAFAKSKGLCGHGALLLTCPPLQDAAAPAKWKITDGNTTLEFTPIDGKFPDYRSVIPATVSGETAQFAAEYIAAFAKARKVYGLNFTCSIGHNGKGAALVNVSSNCVGVLMAFVADPITTRPEWFEELPLAAERTAA